MTSTNGTAAQKVADLPPMMRVEEVAAFLRVNKATIYPLIHEERLQVIRLGRAFRIPRDSLERFVAGDA